MSFIDIASVTVIAGDGGDGIVNFRHEKFIDRGGPDGGDGGDGGDVVFVASWNQNTLANFRFQRELKAKSGTKGGKQRKHGSNGNDLVVAVPVGTIVIDESGKVLADLVEDGGRSVIATGGKGGFGNAHFVSSRRQAPHLAEKGELGDNLIVTLELKMIADVGLIGLPNAGKSTLLSVISNARPEIADYPFTTLTPNLGVVDVDKSSSLLFADIPGLIEGAAEGKGLGDEFLRHVERTAVLLHLIDAYQDNIGDAYKTIQSELKAYKVDLTKLPQVVVINKVEGLDKEIIADLTKQLRKVVPARTTILAISAQTHHGLQDLLRKITKLVDKERNKELVVKKSQKEQIPVLRLADNEPVWHVDRYGKDFIVTGKKIERFAERTDFDNEDGVQRLRDIMKKMGITYELNRQGAKSGSKIIIPPTGQFTY